MSRHMAGQEWIQAAGKNREGHCMGSLGTPFLPRRRQNMKKNLRDTYLYVYVLCLPAVPLFFFPVSIRKRGLPDEPLNWDGIGKRKLVYRSG